MSSRPAPFPTALEAFVELFNEEAFWESHEVLEGPWRENGSDFYHGLILYASAFVHVQRGNVHGILAQLKKAERYLQAYRPAYLGIDLEPLFLHSMVCQKAIREGPQVPATQWQEVIRFPRIQLQAEHFRGDEPELGEEGGDSAT